MRNPVTQEKNPDPHPNLTPTFIFIWLGQFFSMTGSFMTSFALGIWVWQKTESAQAMAMVGVFAYAPLILVTPLAGVLVDRWNRKLVMMLSDLGAVFSSVIVLILLISGDLQLWHIYLTMAVASAFQAFQWPAYSTVITLMVSKDQYSRASGLVSMVESGSNIVGPLLAGALIGWIGLQGILIVDLVTCLLAVTILLMVTIPKHQRVVTPITLRSVTDDIVFGFRYIFQRPGLLGIQLVFFAANFMTVIGWAVISPMVLARSGGNVQLLGFIESTAAVGGLIGAIFLTLWGGPKKLVAGIMIGWILNGLLGRFLMGITTQPWIWILSVFLLAFFLPTINGCNQSLWQRKVSVHHQGRVFSARRFIAQITIPLSMAVAGWLADRVFEPAFATDADWGSRLLGSVFGAGPGAGLSLMMALSGILVTLVGLSGFLFQKIRQVEVDLPDCDSHDPLPPVDQVVIQS